MSWVGILVAIVAAWLAIKVLGFVLKLALWGVVLLGIYWFVAPTLGLPVPALLQNLTA